MFLKEQFNSEYCIIGQGAGLLLNLYCYTETGDKPSLEPSLLMHIDGLDQDCNISIANAVEILQSCTKSLI